MKNAILIMHFFAVVANAQWQQNGKLVCDTSANSNIDPLPQIATDGKGGGIICWRDMRNLNDYDIYAQRVSFAGMLRWKRNGVAIVTMNGNQNFPRICSDDFGGAFVAWEDDRSAASTFVYAQRIDSNGSAIWQTNGTKVAEKGGLFITIAGDGRGGLLMGWIHGGINDVIVQRLDSSGIRVWGDSGIQVTNGLGLIPSNDVAIISDGAGGGIVAWALGNYPNYHIYAQRIDSSGTIRWQPNGILLSDTTLGSGAVALSTDTKGGAFVNWNNTDGTGSVQHITGEGKTLWRPAGIILFASGTGGAKRNSPDAHGGVFVGKGLNIHHLDSLGNKLWGETGVPYYDSLGTTNSCQVFDSYQGVFNFTESFKNGEGFFIRAQWIDWSGNVRLGPEGVRMTPSLPNGSQMWPSAVADGWGGAIVCWEDLLRQGYSTIYVGKIDTGGFLSTVGSAGDILPKTPRLEQNFPNPFNSQTRIRFQIQHADNVTLTIFDVLGREIVTLINGEKWPGRYSVTFDGDRLSSGVYFYRLHTDNANLCKSMILLK